MSTLLVGYDLNSPGQDYEKLIDAIKAEGAWWHNLDSTWLVKTDKTPVQMRDTLSKHLDSSDKLLVLDVTGDSGAWTGFKKSGSDWLKSNL
jgi:hypothetical protein